MAAKDVAAYEPIRGRSRLASPILALFVCSCLTLFPGVAGFAVDDVEPLLINQPGEQSGTEFGYTLAFYKSQSSEWR